MRTFETIDELAHVCGGAMTRPTEFFVRENPPPSSNVIGSGISPEQRLNNDQLKQRLKDLRWNRHKHTPFWERHPVTGFAVPV